MLEILKECPCVHCTCMMLKYCDDAFRSVMKPLRKEAARDIVARVVYINPNMTKVQVFRHVKPLGMPRSTVCRVINAFLGKEHVTRAQNGRPALKMSAKRRQDFVRMANGSQRLASSLRPPLWHNACKNDTNYQRGRGKI